ncbi:hypothetical protein CRYUN_Cryun38cG0019000 [Craigia yunnanensis]
MEDKANEAKKCSFLNSYSSHQADKDEGKNNKAQNLSYLNCLSSAEEDERNKLPKQFFSSYSSVEGQVENNSSTEEILLNDLASQIQSKYDIVRQYSQLPLTNDRIICFVDPLLCEVNAAAYKPKFVIIGPLRRYRTIFEHIEMQKRIYLASFLQRPETKASLNDLCKLIKDSAHKIHGCYEKIYVRTWDFLSHEIQQNQQASDAGVKFKVSTSRCLLDIEFDHRKGEFRIPPLRVDESTEPFFRNLIAWEQRYYSCDTYISDYIFLMAYLIKCTKDVDLLVRRRILINQLGSNTAVVTLFDNFSKNVPKVEKNRYSDIFRKLNAYNAVRHHSWIAILRLQYFSTLWRGVATIAAVVLLVLTLIQTICAVISL